VWLKEIIISCEAGNVLGRILFKTGVASATSACYTKLMWMMWMKSVDVTCGPVGSR